MYTNIKHNPNNLNLGPEDQFFLSYENDETMIKKKTRTREQRYTKALSFGNDQRFMM